MTTKNSALVQNAPKQYRVAILLYPQMLATSLTLPLEMLQAGYAFAKRHTITAPQLTVDLLSQDGKSVCAQSGLQFTASAQCNTAPCYDLIILPSLWRNPRPVLKKHALLIEWLASLKHSNTAIIGVGTGNCFLAEAQLLQGRPATTHWHYAAQFARNYPEVNLKPDYFITQADGLYTVASLNALADVIVHIIEAVYGQHSAHHVQRNFSHEIRKPYEQQRYLEGMNERHPDELIAQIQFWLKSNLAPEHSNISHVAAQFDISPRSLNRRFKAATGQTPITYWQRVRTQAAQELLSSTNLSIGEIALEVGYQDQGQFSRAFKRQLGQTPRDYRQLVRKKLFGE